MKFKYYAAILAGMCLVGFSLGYIIGYYVHSVILNTFLAYIGAPILGIGGGLMIYGTLYNRHS